MDWTHQGQDLWLRRLNVGQYGNNCYIVACPTTGQALVVDTPAEPERILAACQDVKVGLIVITHTHGDHLGAFLEVRRGLKAPVAVHPTEADNLPLPPDRLLQHGETLSIGTLSLKVLHTPGHTPGSICLLAGRHLFSGDTLFPHGPGRTKTNAALRQEADSIRDQLMVLPDGTMVYPGHGEGTVLGKEKAEFAAFLARPWDPSLCGDVLWLGQGA
ncbi:MAG: MBL fold metallo-hydrolase [Chloroflexi bacterium]|nr:MBL fold metallo-hydrolase [Chloroflexota bacterium]